MLLILMMMMEVANLLMLALEIFSCKKLDGSGIATSVVGLVAPMPLANPSLSLPGPTIPSMSSIVAPLVPSLGPTTMPGYMGLHCSAIATPTVVDPVLDPIVVPSDCLLLKNMFDPSNETELDFDLDIKEDMQYECSKFGVVKHIFWIIIVLGMSTCI
jgi:RNA-binding protein 39